MSDAPQRELRLIEMLRSLHEAGIDFLVFGAVAAALHGHVRATRDLAIIIRPTSDNVERVAAWLSTHAAHLATNPEQRFAIRHARALHRGQNATLLVDLGQVDIVQRLPGLPSWETLAASAVAFDVQGMVVRAVDRPTLIERKRPRAAALTSGWR